MPIEDVFAAREEIAARVVLDEIGGEVGLEMYMNACTDGLGSCTGYLDHPVAWGRAVSAATHPLVELGVVTRAYVGTKKYGAELRVGWHHSTIAALQEALDLVVYLEADPDGTSEERAAAHHLAEVLALRVAREIKATVRAHSS